MKPAASYGNSPRRKMASTTRLTARSMAASRMASIDVGTIAAAVRFIREHACDGINVDDVLKAVPLTRRTLESRFRKILDRTPHEEIIRVKIGRVKQLLIETDLKLSTIADRAGFLHVEYMSAAFKKHTGRPPSEFRTAAACGFAIHTRRC